MARICLDTTSQRIYDLLQLRSATDLLHQHNIVFGDLCPNNIVKPADGSGVMLVDFDWCAVAGEGKYPLMINNYGWDAEARHHVEGP